MLQQLLVARPVDTRLRQGIAGHNSRHASTSLILDTTRSPLQHARLFNRLLLSYGSQSSSGDVVTAYYYVYTTSNKVFEVYR
jgi:hypothetical protein